MQREGWEGGGEEGGGFGGTAVPNQGDNAEAGESIRNPYLVEGCAAGGRKEKINTTDLQASAALE